MGFELFGVGFAHPGKTLFDGLDLDLPAGRFTGIIGPNGCGKTTLLRLLRGLLAPAAGRIELAAAPLPRLSRRQLARLVATVPQSANFSFGFSVRETVAMGRFARGGWRRGDAHRAALDRVLDLTDTAELQHRSVQALSAGERQRVLLARALAQETPLLLLDEASSNLDLDHRLEFTELLRRLNREQGTTVVQVSHDLDQTADLCHRILVLDRAGHAAALGTPDAVYTPELFRRVFRVRAEIETHPRTGRPRLAHLAPLVR